MADAPEQVPQTPPVAPAPQPQPQFEPQVAPQAGQPVQYVVTQKSLHGVGGWLLFWVIVFVLAGLGMIGQTFGASDQSTTRTVLDVIFSPILAVGYIGSAVLIIMQKKLGKIASVATLGLSMLNGIISTVMNSTEDTGKLITNILVGVILTGLLTLYFFQSRRVKETLIK
ncbi:MAG: hypothetical protein WAT17_00030 [Candidatus Saccharimonadales bacterium]|jgi:cytochrome c oxidase subunit IV